MKKTVFKTRKISSKNYIANKSYVVENSQNNVKEKREKRKEGFTLMTKAGRTFARTIN